MKLSYEVTNVIAYLLDEKQYIVTEKGKNPHTVYYNKETKGHRFKVYGEIKVVYDIKTKCDKYIGKFSKRSTKSSKKKKSSK